MSTTCGVEMGTRESGFTLLEMICVLVIIGVLSAAAAVRTLDLIAVSKLDGEAERLKSQIRYIQIWSVSQADRIYGIRCAANDCEAFYINTALKSTSSLDISSRNPFPLPGTSSGTLVLSDAQVADFNLAFDGAGRPFSGAGNTLGLAAVAVDIVLTGANGSQTISVTPDTGFVP